MGVQKLGYRVAQSHAAILQGRLVDYTEYGSVEYIIHIIYWMTVILCQTNQCETITIMIKWRGCTK